MIQNMMINCLFYVLVMAMGYQIHLLSDKLGITVSRKRIDCNLYYTMLGILLAVTFIATIVLIANKDVGMLIAPYVLGLGLYSIREINIRYKNQLRNSRIIKRTGLLERIAFGVVILIYFFLNKDRINNANYRIEKYGQFGFKTAFQSNQSPNRIK